jgi:citrate/tricarballylate utilization protein
MSLAEPAAADALRDARREFEICNACRYCEGFCAVFPAMTQRREFTDGDLSYLANLCHNCKGCYHACQYAPPHPFGVNLPQTLARVRMDSYEAYAWPAPLAALYRRNGVSLSLITAVLIALVLGLVFWLKPVAAGMTHGGPGAFYAVVPWVVMTGTAGAAIAFSLVALAVGAVRFWRDTGGGSIAAPAPLAQAAGEALSLRYLGGGHEGEDGCNDTDEGFSQTRRRFHHALFYGFALCFASTTVAFLYDHFLYWPAPYPLFSLPVTLGVLGGIAMVVGAAGLTWVKIAADPAPTARSVLGADYALLALLTLTAATGLLLLGVRETPAMGTVLAVHLALVLTLFLTLPYGKMVHGLYRSLALLRHAIEERKPPAPVAPTPPRAPRFVVTRSRSSS